MNPQFQMNGAGRGMMNNNMSQMNAMNQMNQAGQMGQMGQMNPMAQMGNMGQMRPMSQMGQMNQMGQLGQMGYMGNMGQMNQMNQANGMAQMNQMNGMGQMNQSNPMAQMNQMGQMGQMSQMNQMNQMNQMQQNPNMAAMNGQNFSANSLMKQIAGALQSQGPMQGWQGEVPITERVQQVRLLVDSLRLVRPPVDVGRAVEVALTFETKAFRQSSTKETYLKECQEKLTRIRDQRAQQANQAMANGGNPNMANQNPNMQQMQQLQQMGVNVNLPQHLQQQLQQQQVMDQNRAPSNTMNQTPGMSNQQNVANGGQPKLGMLSELTPEENRIINARAAELAKNTPQEEMQNILQKMDQGQREKLLMNKVDPMQWWFRIRALKEFRHQKALQAGMNGQNPQMMQL
jgi:hypothetical protein